MRARGRPSPPDTFSKARSKVLQSIVFCNLKSKVDLSFFQSLTANCLPLPANCLPLTASALARTRLISTSPALLNPCFSFSLSKSVRPQSSSTVRTPSFAISSRISWAMNFIKFSTYSGFPGNFARSFSFCVATPNGQVSSWQTRIIEQPIAIRGAVAKPNSSAPRRAAIVTSLPLISLPSVSMTTRPRSPF